MKRNCDLLEMNRCGDDEYRCENGMCLPDQFFLDGEFNCLDWSDEKQFKADQECPRESVSTECDDHICPMNWWSCGDGECIRDRLAFQRFYSYQGCQSRRDQYFICETNRVVLFSWWTMPNGRCLGANRYPGLPMTNRSDTEQCEYLLKCTLSRGGEEKCPCHGGPGCEGELARLCPLSLIQYPRRSVVAPSTFFLFNRTRDWLNCESDFVLLNGTIRCRSSLIPVRKKIPFDSDVDLRRVIEEESCQSILSNLSFSAMFSTRDECHHSNESSDLCQEWNGCLSLTRIKDGAKNCWNEEDERQRTEMEIEKSCARVRRHRFRCSSEEPSCLPVSRLGDSYRHCPNGFDEL